MIGVFDSGVGGLSVLRQIHQLCPSQPTLYFADQAHIPYGPRPTEEIRHFSAQICQYLLDRGAEIIVIACNTATAASINWLREQYPAVSFVGMEPAIKPAAQHSTSGRIGVMATASTFKSQRYAQLMQRYAQNTQLFENSCVGLVSQIEAGELDTATTDQMLTAFINPMLAEKIDTLILGCTHYPFVRPAIEKIVGDGVRVIDPAHAVALQTKRLLAEITKPPQTAGRSAIMHEYVTSGELANFIPLVNRFLTVDYNRSQIEENGSINIAKYRHLNFYQKVHNN